MLNIKKLFTSILNALVFTTDTKESSSFSVSASDSGNTTIDVAKTGYTPLGIVGLEKTGGGSGDVLVSSYIINGTTASIYVRNLSTSSRTITVKARVLYQKNG